ncbi:MAG: glutamine-hydrolyzing carbamoyl-phosphate synthase small subunit [Chloroflexota bacterium]
MAKSRFLILSDGTVFDGIGFGFDLESIGEVVFNTSMTGYQEMLTDPSYEGQILVATYPLVGNYGVSDNANESHNIKIQSFILRDLCEIPFHYDNKQTLEEFLVKHKIPGIHSVDTRSLTKKIRKDGAMMGIVSNDGDLKNGLDKIRKFGNYEDHNHVERVSIKKEAVYSVDKTASKFSVALIDFGVKNNIVRLLNRRQCDVTVFPWKSNFEEIAQAEFDGVVLSPGPGDPSVLKNQINKVRELTDKLPTLAICLGHQILAIAYGGKTFKLLFGHRGANQPVKDLISGKVYPTAQNHGFAVSKDNFPSELEITHLNINDDTISGFRHRTKPVISIQYHSEACPGPIDSEYIFDEFIELMEMNDD